jgi:acyl-CoA reductase-like NAD-dependent aldehyde dehydrogenase
VLKAIEVVELACASPTVFDNVTPDMSCGNQEVFGPVLYMKRIADFNEGVELINESKFANGATIFTQSGQYAREFARRITGAGKREDGRRIVGLTALLRRGNRNGA